MGYFIKEVLIFYDHEKGYDFERYQYKDPWQLPSPIGEWVDFAPETGRKLINHNSSKISLFNKVGITSIPVELGKHGLFLLCIRPDYVLKEIYVDPEEIDVEIYFNDESLMYGFYNNTSRDNIKIDARIDNDDEDVYGKLKEYPSDIHWYKYFLKKSLKKHDNSHFERPSEPLPEHLTIKDFSKYAHLSSQTIYNKVNKGEIIPERAGRRLLFKKSDIDEWLKTGMMGGKRKISKR